MRAQDALIAQPHNQLPGMDITAGLRAGIGAHREGVAGSTVINAGVDDPDAVSAGS
jgi:hypothetical protein